MTSRKYDASRRTAAAQRTREAIVAAAFQLHGLGIFDFESLAARADVSVPTVRKHFPTREALFGACTAYGLHQAAAVPNVERIASEPDPAARTGAAVRETYAFHESLLGQMWSAFRLADESPTLARSIQEVEELVGTLADLVVDAWPVDAVERAGSRGLIAGFLSPLTYRGLRVHGGLSPDRAVDATCSALLARLRALDATAPLRDKGPPAG